MMQCKTCHGISELDRNAEFMLKGECVYCEENRRAAMAGVRFVVEEVA